MDAAQMTGHEVLLPTGMIIDGAIVELAQAADGTITAGLRIPAPYPPSAPAGA